MSIAKRLAERQREVLHIDVAEWPDENGKPERVFYTPLTAGELDRIQRKHPTFLTTSSFAGMVDLIISKALNGQGEKVFSLEDKQVLLREETSVIARIAGAFMSGRTQEDLEKN
jgi:hypothetical protein